MEKTEFINKLAPLAQAEATKRKAAGKGWVLPSICIAQAALETGWGSSALMTKANAFFGIKATNSWKGKVYSSKTKECYDGVNYTTITDAFRAYDSLEESVADYYDLITSNSRYKAAVNETDANKCITAIKTGGYATSPTYIDNVMSIVNTNNLTRYDSVVTGTSAEQKEQAAKSVKEVAQEVIAGKWGNGDERKEKLVAAGYDYATVQKKVNELMK
jgi:flagellum-specific peptidoglycan hydrolase FlgJ